MSTKRLALMGTLVLAGCGTPDGASTSGGRIARSDLGSGRCFSGDALTNFNVKDRHTLYVSTRLNYVYRLDTSEDCFAIGSQNVAVAPFLRSGPNLCVGGQATVSSSQSRSLPTRCIATVTGPIADSRESGLSSRLNQN